MAIPAGVVKYTFSGTLAGGEIFATSLWVTGVTVSSQNDANLLASTAATTLTESGQALLAIIGTDAAYTKVTAYCYPTGGPTATFIGEAVVTGMVGSGSGAPVPLQTCLVATLRTGFSGRSFRGRMYLPATALALPALHQVAAGPLVTLASGFASFLSAFSANNGGDPVVVSQTRSTATLITSITIDSKPDIQRRRADKLAATTTVPEPVTNTP